MPTDASPGHIATDKFSFVGDAGAATLRALAGLESTSAALKTRIAEKLEAQATPPKPQAAARKPQDEFGKINKTIEKQKAVVAASQEAATEALRSIADGEKARRIGGSGALGSNPSGHPCAAAAGWRIHNKRTRV